MLRLAIILSCGVLAAIASSTGSLAAERGFAPGLPRVAPMRAPFLVAPTRVPVLQPALGVRPWRGAGHRPYGWRQRRFDRDSYGYPSPWYDGGYGAASGGVTVIERQAETPRAVDPDAFENLTVRSGILSPPVPEPTIYRLEGPRARPVTRVIRVTGGDEVRMGSARSRFAHAETGALLLTVPGR